MKKSIALTMSTAAVLAVLAFTERASGQTKTARRVWRAARPSLVGARRGQGRVATVR